MKSPYTELQPYHTCCRGFLPMQGALGSLWGPGGRPTPFAASAEKDHTLLARHCRVPPPELLQRPSLPWRYRCRATPAPVPLPAWTCLRRGRRTTDPQCVPMYLSMQAPCAGIPPVRRVRRMMQKGSPAPGGAPYMDTVWLPGRPGAALAKKVKERNDPQFIFGMVIVF